jgi:hypothetical protein
MHNVGNAFSLPFKSPNWFSTLLVIGLIGLIPIVGWINMAGWMLATLDNYRRGSTDLPPAGFQYIGRGGNLFVVGLVYGLVITLILVVPVIVMFGLLAGSSAASPTGEPGPAGVLAGGVFSLWILGAMVVSVVEYALLPAVVFQTERGGIGGGLNVAAVLRTAAASWKNTLIAGVLIYAANFIGGLGIYACCVGVLLTYPYAVAVTAGIMRYFEATFETPQLVPPSSPAPPSATA